MFVRLAFAVSASLLASVAAKADEQAAIDGCIDRLRAVGGPDGQNGGQVLRSDYSEAGTLVTLRDAGGSVWRCLAANDGTVTELSVTEAADDGQGALAGGNEPATETKVVKFTPGASGAHYTGRLEPGASLRYVLGARKNQFLEVRFPSGANGVSYQIFNPDQSFLLDQVSGSLPYKGQLWQDGNHVIEVINRGGRSAPFAIQLSVN
ncbi:hypothetical protein ACQKGL_13900 [Ensifer adhaerens]|uniref:hypothetical protein n=1 Tax=Ensifer adhaerens TaxID=106592 RepID=UPI003D012E82